MILPLLISHQVLGLHLFLKHNTLMNKRVVQLTYNIAICSPPHYL